MFSCEFGIFLEAIISQNTSGRFLLLLVANLFGSSHRKCSVRKNVLRNFTKFTRKHLSQSLFFNKVSGLRPANLLKKRPWLRRFPMNFAKFLRTTFLTEHFRWLLLSIFGIFVIFSAETVDCNLKVIQLVYSVKFINFDSFQKHFTSKGKKRF